jgi:hypothetical protein
MNQKRNIICVFLLGFGLSLPANAQVFGTQSNSATNTQPQQIVQPSKPASQPLQAVQPQNTASAKKQPAETTNDDTFSPVKKNFDNAQQTNEVVNTESKVQHFRIVNGEIQFDNDDKRSVLVYYDNYQIHRGIDKMVKCTIRVYVLNDLKEKITSLGFKLKWPDISTSVEMNHLKPGVSTYTDLMLLGEGCLHMDKTPTIEVNRCRVKGMTQDACADAIKWFPKKH